MKKVKLLFIGAISLVVFGLLLPKEQLKSLPFLVWIRQKFVTYFI